LSGRIRSRQSAEDGFTMIEAVVALALVAVVLAAIGTLVAANARGAQTLDQHTALMQTARMIASALPRNGEPLPKDLAGEVSGYRWQMRASPFFGGGPVVPESRFIPQRIELRVRSPSGAIATFETVRLQNRSAH
jgi:general secretion pathway protein I